MSGSDPVLTKGEKSKMLMYMPVAKERTWPYPVFKITILNGLRIGPFHIQSGGGGRLSFLTKTTVWPWKSKEYYSGLYRYQKYWPWIRSVLNNEKRCSAFCPKRSDFFGEEKYSVSARGDNSSWVKKGPPPPQDIKCFDPYVKMVKSRNFNPRGLL